MVKLGVLDYGQIDEGSSAKQALHQTVELAQLTESLGYERFWMAEHHNVPAFASSSPELIMMRLADATERIGIGSGGVMIPNYSPYKVAENFRVLEAFHPGRIDLGVGNSVGTPIVNQVLNETKSSKLSYEQSLIDLTKYLNNQADDTHRFSGITAHPVVATVPDIWTLSASVKSAQMAAKLGIGFTYGFFLTGMDQLATGIQAAETYRKEFISSPFMPKPKVSLAVIVAVGETDDEVKAYEDALDLWMLGKDDYSYLQAFPSAETARTYAYTEEEKVMVQANRKKRITGNVESVSKQLKALVAQFKADEVLLLPLMPGISARKKAIELLADILE